MIDVAILVGGKGSRLGKITKYEPKPLLKIGKIRFLDLIISNLLKYNLEKNALKALESGCNLVLHCNGNIREMIILAKHIPKIDKFTQKKTSHFYKFLG